MKIKKTPVGQHIFDGIGDTDNSYEIIQDFLPLIGSIVVSFNALEATLDSMLCETFSDRSDQKGLIVLHSMMYSTKVDLFKKFNDDFIRGYGWDIPEYKPLISNLKDCGILRNKVVHANWEYTNSEGYTQVKYKYGNNGLEHEMCQFTVDSLNSIIVRLDETHHALSDFDEICSEKISEWNRQVIDYNSKRNRSE